VISAMWFITLHFDFMYLELFSIQYPHFLPLGITNTGRVSHHTNPGLGCIVPVQCYSSKRFIIAGSETSYFTMSFGCLTVPARRDLQRRDRYYEEKCKAVS